MIGPDPQEKSFPWKKFSLFSELVSFRVIHPATLGRNGVPRIRLRLEVENTVQRGISAPRELPKAPSVEVLPRPVRIASARFRRPVAAAKALGHV